MTLTDDRLPKWDHKGSAGVTRQFVFTEADANAITSLSVWVGGTVSPDVDDTTGASEYVATISGSSNEIATVSVPIPASPGTTPLRLEVDGSIRTVGKLQASTSGTSSSSSAVTISTGSASFSLSVSGGLISVGGVDGGTADANFTGTTPIDGGTA